MKIAVFEDDRPFAMKLEQLISQHTHFPTSCNTGCAGTMLRFIDSMCEPVLFFLDIVADDTTRGYELADRIKEADNDSRIIFVTDYPDIILNNAAYKSLSLSQILKSNNELEQEICATLDIAESIFKQHCLLIRHNRFETLYIAVQEICYIEKIKGINKIAIHCLDGEYVLSSTLKEILVQLNRLGCRGQFVQCHKSFVMNKFTVRKISTSTREVIFRNGRRCPYGFVFRAYMFCVRAEHEYIHGNDGGECHNL